MSIDSDLVSEVLHLHVALRSLKGFHECGQ